MRKNTYIALLSAIVVLFFISFFIGRNAALSEAKEKEVGKNESLSETKEDYAPVVSESDKIKKEPLLQKTKSSPPERMNFPAENSIIKDYSQSAVYSKTMGDWRAHLGIDYKAEKGSDVLAVWNGVVKEIRTDSLWGTTLKIEHDGGILSVYKNLGEVIVTEGENVKTGQAVAKAGDSASVEKREEEHLHFEIWVNGEPINPNSYVY